MLHMDAVTFLHGKTSKEIAALKNANVIQVLMPKDKEFLNKKLKKHIEVIPNIVSQEMANQNEKVEKEKTIVNIGRLDKKQKQQHLLIDAFAIIASKYPDWQLHLYGGDFTKNYRSELKMLVRKYNLENQVKLMGVTNDSTSVLKKAEIFVFPSAFEGFGLALAEAMAVGLPCLGLKSCLAVSQLITNNVTGILTDSTKEALAEGLERLLLDEALRTRLGVNAKEAMEDFLPEKIWDKWENLFCNVVAEANHLCD